MYCIQTHQLSHAFSNGQPVLENVNLSVKQGSIYGFLGPNGAGKTTTLRLILGLLKPQKGSIELFGQPLRPNQTEHFNQIGSLIESPSLYGHLSATENLRVWQKLFQCPLQRIPEVLQLTGLSDTGGKKTRSFSLGMKQRLGIAISLMHSPTLLILDEPTNGLDPAGIVEIRELLINLNKSMGITILISSHLLAEMEKLVTDVGIIHQGKMRFEGPLETLMNIQKNASLIAFTTNNPPSALAIIAPLHPNAQVESSRVMVPNIQDAETAQIARQLIQQGIDIYGITRKEENLETIFMNITNTQ